MYSHDAHPDRSPRRRAAALTTAGILVATGMAVGSAGAATAAERTAATPAGTLDVSLTNDVVESVPSLTQMPTSREGFVSASAVARSTGDGATGVTSGTLDAGYQVGCAVDVSGGVQLALETLAGPALTLLPTLGMGLNMGITPSILVNPKPGTSQNVSMGKQTASGPGVEVSFDAVHITVDGCLGGVTVRPYAIYSVTTAGGSHSVATYGEPRPL